MYRPARAIACLLALSVVPPALAATVRQITDFRTSRLGEYAVDDAGNAVVAVSSADPFGANPYHEYQVVAWTGAGTGSALTRFGGLLTTVSVSDDGQWIAFASLADPLGNGAGVFLQSADGTVLRRLLASTASRVRISGSGNRVVANGWVIEVGSGLVTSVGWGESITDDGGVIVYSAGGRVYRVAADGSGRQQITPPDVDDATSPMISGDGQRVSYESGGQIHVIDSTGSAPLVIGPGRHPSITDDHAWVYYSALDEDNLEIWRAQIDTGIRQRLTRTAPPLSNDHPLVSGSGNRVAFVRHGTLEYPDGARTLMRMNSNGSAVEQLGAAEADFRSWDPEITADGTRVVFVGGPPDRYDVFRVQADGSDLVRITDGAEALHPSVSGDGETIVFESSLDLTGDNACGTPQVFKITADGSGLARLSPLGSCAARRYPVISRDGRTVVYQEDGMRLFAVPAAGGTPSQIVTDSSTYPKLPRLSGDGSLVVYESDAGGGTVRTSTRRSGSSTPTALLNGRSRRRYRRASTSPPAITPCTTT